MGKKKAQQKQEEEEEEVEVKDMPKVELGDILAMKNILDDMVIEFYKENEYSRDMKWDNMKLVLMIVSCVVAACSHFHGIKPPNDTMVVYFFVSLYFIISAYLFYFCTFVEKDIVATINLNNQKVYVRGKQEKYDEYYNVSIESEGKKTVSDKIYVGKVFDVDGYFDEETFFDWMESLMTKFKKQ